MPEITVDTSRILARFPTSPIGINLDYLVDSDSNRPSARSIEETLREMGARWLRYPGGGKSDRHLWSKPPYDRPDPQVFSPYREYGAGHKPMDFDEYMGCVQAVGATPFVVVGYKLQESSGIFKETYLQNAVEWVRYANITKGCGLKYWEIGNENWLNNCVPPDHMAEVVREFSQAMKAADPTILIGSNGFGKDWWNVFLPKAAPYVDFLTLSNYPCGGWLNYDYYRAHPEVVVVEQVEIAADAIAALPVETDRERLFIIVTELNSMDYVENGWPNRNNIGHSLVMVEIVGRAILNPKVRAAMLWHTRWVLPEPETIWYAVGRTNEIFPSGRAVAVWGQFPRDTLVAVDRTDTIVTFATGSSAAGELNVLLANKDLAAAKTRVRIQSDKAYHSARVFRFHGQGPDDMRPIWEELAPVPVRGNTVSDLDLPGVSLTVLSLP